MNHKMIYTMSDEEIIRHLHNGTFRTTRDGATIKTIEIWYSRDGNYKFYRREGYKWWRWTVRKTRVSKRLQALIEVARL